MNVMFNKALLIAAGVFITLALASGTLFVLSQIQKIYSQVGQTNISIKSNFKEYEKYNYSVLTGVDMLNTAKKYYQNGLVTVNYVNTTLNKTATQLQTLTTAIKTGTDTNYRYEYKYSVTYVDNGGYITITFVKI